MKKIKVFTVFRLFWNQTACHLDSNINEVTVKAIRLLIIQPETEFNLSPSLYNRLFIYIYTYERREMSNPLSGIGQGNTSPPSPGELHNCHLFSIFKKWLMAFAWNSNNSKL